MVTIKGKEIDCMGYDLDIGYYTMWDFKDLFKSFKPSSKHSINNRCIMIPSPPKYNNRVFSKGNLFTKSPKFDEDWAFC